ncbi:MAG: PilN domain-containing protein [Coriobacteriia bacterium]|nr:PilN domain-containing protein [Coriobacteriia bacterium]
MMRINLLPPEILERRKAEKRIGWVVVAAIAVALVLAGVWGVGFMSVQGKRDELAAIQQQVQTTQAQANQLAIFEERAVELEGRRGIVTLALGDKINWAKLLDELSLVLPSDVWVSRMAFDQITGLQIQGYAVDAPTDTPDAGHKSIAKTLVRLADLEQLYNVWLTNSVKELYEEQDAIQFTITTGVVVPAVEGETP